MEIWIIKAGSYADEWIVGFATSAEEAVEVLARAEAHPGIRPDFEEDYTVYGPFKQGALYDGAMRTLTGERD